jgi:hypothetical protein
MNSDYNFLCYKSVLSHIDMDVSEGPATPFRFEGSLSYLRVKLVVISDLSLTRSFNSEYGGIL